MINVNFKVLNLKDQISTIQNFLSSDNRTSHIVADYFGFNLEELLKMDEKQRNREIEKFITIEYEKCRNELEISCNNFQNAWDENQDFINNELTKIFGQEFDFECTAYVNLNPVWPRFLEQKSFDVNLYSSPDYLLLSASHELVHFAWFEIWKKNFEDCKKEEFDFPHLPWLISEIAIEPIFRYSKLRTLSKQNPAYDYFYTDKIGNKTIAEIANEIYSESQNINDFQKNIYDFFKKTEKTKELVK